jgi:hypothetical protein
MTLTFFKRGAALGLSLLSLGAANPLCAQAFRFPWDPPERPPVQAPPRQPAVKPTPSTPLAPPPLTQARVRAALAREGARLIGAPKRRGGETVAVGRDSDGGRRKFTLDAEGSVIDIEILATPDPAPRQSPDNPDALPGPAPAAAPAPRREPASSDASLSPIKPLRAPGAPRIEPLPQ